MLERRLHHALEEEGLQCLVGRVDQELLQGVGPQQFEPKRVQQTDPLVSLLAAATSRRRRRRRHARHRVVCLGLGSGFGVRGVGESSVVWRGLRVQRLVDAGGDPAEEGGVDVLGERVPRHRRLVGVEADRVHGAAARLHAPLGQRTLGGLRQTPQPPHGPETADRLLARELGSRGGHG